MTSITSSPPITELRPLHCLQPEASRQGASAASTELAQWQSALSPRPDDETCIKAFVKLVSRIVVLEDGEAYCIQKRTSTHGSGFILAHAGQDKFSFVECHNASDEIPSDFSIGDGNLIEAPKVSFSVKHLGERSRRSISEIRADHVATTY